jgi:hypothetical protein
MPTPIQIAGAMLNAPADRKALSTALGFERVLLAELAKALLPQTGDAESNPYADVLPGALADGIEQAGGLGLAGEIAQRLGAAA